MLKKNKRGQFIEILLFVVILIVASLIIYILSVFNNNIVHAIDEDGVITSQRGNETIQDAKNSMIPIGDNFIFWLLVTFMLGLLIMAIFTNFHPIVVVPFIIIMLIILFLLMQGVNMYDDMRLDLDSEIEGSKTFTLSNSTIGSAILPVIFFIIFVAMMWIMFGRKDGGGGGF